MSDNIHKIIKESPKALTEIENSNLAKFIGQVIGEPIANSVGIITDKLKHYRLRNAFDLQEKTLQRLQRKGVNPEEYRILATKFVIPLIENATLEDDDELRTLWSKLLANALDPNFSSDISTVHVSFLKEMMPLDIKILHTLYNEIHQHSLEDKRGDVRFEKDKIAKLFNTDIDTNIIEISLLNLMRLGCIKGGNVVFEGIRIGNTPNTNYLGTKAVHLSALGLDLCNLAIVT